MSWTTPTFWYAKKPNALSFVLTPLSWLYALGGAVHHAVSRPYRCGVPVICVGNLVAGGSGKTPTAIALLELIKTNGLAENPVFLTRGYGGDEDKILSKYAPTIVNANRAEGAREAVKQTADMIIMDDGFQNPSLQKDISLIVIDGAMGFGNKQIIPAGPLRQHLRKGLRHADGFIVIGEDLRDVTSNLPKDTSRFGAKFVPVKELDKSKSYFAFAGLGYPQKFFDTLEGALGKPLADTESFPDHHPYSEQDILKLRERAAALDATLITTEKDAVRLPALARTEIEVLPVKLQWKDEEKLVSYLKSILKPDA